MVMNITKTIYPDLSGRRFPVLASLFLVLLYASCSNEMEPVDTTGDTQFTVAEFPAFDQPQSRTVGTPDNGKTNWENGDEILIRAHTRSVNADQYFSLVYDGSTWSGTSFPYEYGIPEFTAYYAPNCEWTSDDAPVLKAGAIGGTGEYLKGEVTKSNGSFLISFDKTQRTYSRFRVATFPNDTVIFEKSNFVSADETKLDIETKELTADQNGNIFIYGSFNQRGYIAFKNSTSFVKVNYDSIYVARNSYVIDLSSPYRKDGNVITIRLTNSLTDDYLSSLMQIVSATKDIDTIVVKGEPTVDQQNIIAEAIKDKTLTLSMPNTNKADIIEAIKNASGITLLPGYEIDDNGIYLLHAGDCFPTVVDKVEASGKGCTLKLMKDITVNQDLYIENNSSLTIDLNNYTIKNENLRNPLFRIIKGTLTVKSSENGKITVENCNIFYVQKEGNLVINGGTFESSQYIVYNQGSGAKTTINSGIFDSKLTPVYVDGTCEINDGIFSGEEYAFECSDDSYVTIYGGSFTGEDKDLCTRSKTGILNFNSHIGKGAVFPGGISRVRETGFDLNKLLSSEAGYFNTDGDLINVQDGYNSCIDQGDVIVKKTIM